ncbi:hypothetical protein DP113_34655 (plasmid) [Brasilonema octagenarum UFV-E1]|uniref:DUF6876 domain-containing protein n=2 Tax=Brasilonema TaxID=383614 RepID=A0A856MQL0_9CYAN|nr:MULTISPECIES: DUF6876 family protein [Brasilonema]NMF63281.1 hypothetical protein [Brasilonema octagenarum UFV-OR1]QDL12849.1 hypothetical protein DP114_34550 [Brasilonema sennae CENA114]QDL19245.1 hypothetical protein DP113_34655 [Brasilonema octagenarum UFV-E1]
MKKPDEITADLKQFIGSDIIYKHWLGIGFTEGVKYLADTAEAYWLIDAIASHQTQTFLSNTKLQYFQIWHLLVKGKSGTLICEWDTDKEILRQELEYTDFSLSSIKLYLVQRVLMLPNEY